MVQVKLLYVLNCQHFDLFQLLALGIPTSELRLCLQLKVTMAMLLPESNQGIIGWLELSSMDRCRLFPLNKFHKEAGRQKQSCVSIIGHIPHNMLVQITGHTIL